jgi:YggT family protein
MQRLNPDIGLFGRTADAKGRAALHVFPRAPSMRAILDVLLLALNLYTWIIIAAAVISWLIAFNVVNTRNEFVRSVESFLYRVTEPVLGPIRRILPNLGGIDVSPIILLLIIFFIQRVIVLYLYPVVP